VKLRKLIFEDRVVRVESQVALKVVVIARQVVEVELVVLEGT